MFKEITWKFLINLYTDYEIEIEDIKSPVLSKGSVLFLPDPCHPLAHSCSPTAPWWPQVALSLAVWLLKLFSLDYPSDLQMRFFLKKTISIVSQLFTKK